MFRGSYPTRMDDKGRLKVPADFKRVLDDEHSGTTKFYITSRDGKVGEIYPMRVWEDIEAKLDRLPTASPAVQKFLDFTSYYGHEVEMDGQGRLLLPGELREDANLNAEVKVIGRLRYMQVRNQEAYRKRITENPPTNEEQQELSNLGI
jgi:MraZ protein